MAQTRRKRRTKHRGTAAGTIERRGRPRAQTRRKRRTKHRGTPAGTIESRGRTGRKPRPEERKGDRAPRAKRDRFAQPPTWKCAVSRAAIAAGIFLVAVAAIFRQKIVGAIS